MGIIGRLRAKGERIVLSKILAVIVTKLAEGDFGDGPKKLYWWLSGKKTALGLLFGAAWALLDYGQTSGFCLAQGLDCAGLATTLGTIAAFLLAAGLYDGALRSPAPNKYAGLLVLLCLIPLGCASGQVRLGREPRPLAPDPEVVESLVCKGDEDGAARYIELRAGSLADRIEFIERARKSVAGKPGCCAGTRCATQ